MSFTRPSLTWPPSMMVTLLRVRYYRLVGAVIISTYHLPGIDGSGMVRLMIWPTDSAG